MKKWKKYLLYGFIGFLIIGTLAAIFGEKVIVESISIQEKQLTLDTKKEKEVKITVEPNDIRLSKSDFIMSDDSIVEIDSIDANTITLKTLSNEGTTTLYCQRDDIKSNEITVQVIDQNKLALAKAEEQRLAEEKVNNDKKIEEAKAAELKKVADAKKVEETKKAQKQSTQKSTTSNKTSSSVSTTKPTGQNVYITPTGKKYHAIAKCGNTKSSTLVSLSDAQGRGLGACSKCY